MLKKIIIRLSLCIVLLAVSTSIVHADFPPFPHAFYGRVHIIGEPQGFPPLPHAFYGRVYINGEPAPVGVQIEGRGENVEVNIPGNPIKTTEIGFYGSTDNTKPMLLIQGDLSEGTLIEFYVDGEKALCGQDGEWQKSYPFSSGEITSLDLWVGPLQTEEPLPTVTRTPTFAPTVQKTATPTKVGQVIQATVTPQDTAEKFTPSPSPTMTLKASESTSISISTSTSEPSSTPIAVAETGESESGGSPGESENEITPTQQDQAVTETPMVAESDRGRINPGIFVIMAIVLIGGVVALWMFIRKKQSPTEREELL